MVVFFNNSSNPHAHQLLNKMILHNFISLQVFIYFLHEKHAAVWNFTSFDLHRSELHLPWTQMNANNEIWPQSEISNRFELTSGLM